MCRLEHVPIRLHELAEPQAHLRVGVEMLAVRFRALRPEVHRRPHEGRAGREVIGFHGVGHAVDETSVEVLGDRFLKCLAVGCRHRHAAAEPLRHAFDHRLVVHLHAVHAGGFEAAMIVIVKRGDLRRRDHADVAAPVFRVEVRVLREDARAERALAFGDVVLRQASAIHAAPVAGERVPDEERAHAEVLLGELHRRAQVAVEARLVRLQRDEAFLAARHFPVVLPTVIEDEQLGLDPAGAERLQPAAHARGIHLFVKRIPGAPAEVVHERGQRFVAAQASGAELLHDRCRAAFGELIGILARRHEHGRAAGGLDRVVAGFAGELQAGIAAAQGEGGGFG